jgi:hypothetical protein
MTLVGNGVGGIGRGLNWQSQFVTRPMMAYFLVTTATSYLQNKCFFALAPFLKKHRY